MFASAADGAKLSSRAVDAAGALCLGRDVDRVSSAETALTLLAALTSQPGTGRAAAAEFHDAGAVVVRMCLRSVALHFDRSLP